MKDQTAKMKPDSNFETSIRGKQTGKVLWKLKKNVICGVITIRRKSTRCCETATENLGLMGAVGLYGPRTLKGPYGMHAASRFRRHGRSRSRSRRPPSPWAHGALRAARSIRAYEGLIGPYESLQTLMEWALS